MNILIKINYKSDSDSKLLQKASFPVNTYKFKQDPNKEAARVAYEWWKFVKREMSYRVRITEVTYNEGNDITELVRYCVGTV